MKCGNSAQCRRCMASTKSLHKDERTSYNIEPRADLETIRSNQHSGPGQSEMVQMTDHTVVEFLHTFHDPLNDACPLPVVSDKFRRSGRQREDSLRRRPLVRVLHFA